MSGRRIAASDPARVAVVDADGTSTTYGELLATSRAIARGIRELGDGDRRRAADDAAGAGIPPSGR
jgi:hypothetical protein